MSEAKFTRGPWFVDSKLIVGPRINSDGQDDGFIYEVCDVRLSIGDKKANAHLIAAAPDLYDSLSDLVSSLECSDIDLLILREEIKVSRAALAKARGES